MAGNVMEWVNGLHSVRNDGISFACNPESRECFHFESLPNLLDVFVRHPFPVPTRSKMTG